MNERDLRQALIETLSGYLMGRIGLDDFRAWEAEYAFDPDAIGTIREDLDRLTIVLEEVEDGVRNEDELRQLAVAVLATQSLKVPAVALVNSAVEPTTVSLDVDDRRVITIQREMAFAGT